MRRVLFALGLVVFCHLLIGNRSSQLSHNEAPVLFYEPDGLDRLEFRPGNGSPAGRTGAPGEVTCSSGSFCHSGTPVGTVSISSVNSYTPNGADVNITVSLTGAGSTSGFQLTALNSSNAKVGTLNVTGPVTKKLSGSRDYITHSAATRTSWTMSWTPPPTDVGDVTFYVAASGSNSQGHRLSQKTVSAAIPTPTSPTGLNAVASISQVNLNWNASAGATSYTVYRSVSPNAAAVLQAGVTQTSYQDQTAVVGTTYFYRVTASNGSGESTFSNEDSATPIAAIPTPPSGLIATPGDAKIDLIWQPSPGADSYTVFRATASPASEVLEVGVISSAYTDGSAINGTTYFYRVTATNVSGESGFSNETSATPMVPLAPPKSAIQSTGECG